MKFDIKTDNQQIASGQHFWCEACLAAVPVEKRSLDSNYCQSCFDSLAKDKERVANRGHDFNGETHITTQGDKSVTTRLQNTVRTPILGDIR